jgi:signal transduction histidine kinase
VGISDDMKENVFNRAIKKDKSTGGMGIGLSLVKIIVDGYGGKVWVENKENCDYTKGSVFVNMLRAA